MPNCKKVYLYVFVQFHAILLHFENKKLNKHFYSAFKTSFSIYKISYIIYKLHFFCTMIITYFHPFFNSISYVTFKLQTNTAQKIFKPTLYSIFINILFINIKHTIGFFIYDRVPFV